MPRVQATPWSERERPEPSVTFREAPEDTGPAPATAPPALPRAFEFLKRDLDKHGHTDGCPQCEHWDTYREPKPGGKHNNSCRARLMEAIEKDGTAGGERVKR